MTAIKQNHINKLDPFFEHEILNSKAEELNPREARARRSVKRDVSRRERRVLKARLELDAQIDLSQEEIKSAFRPKFKHKKSFRLIPQGWMKWAVSYAV